MLSTSTEKTTCGRKRMQVVGGVAKQQFLRGAMESGLGKAVATTSVQLMSWNMIHTLAAQIQGKALYGAAARSVVLKSVKANAVVAAAQFGVEVPQLQFRSAIRPLSICLESYPEVHWYVSAVADSLFAFSI